MTGPGRRFNPAELTDSDGTPLDEPEAAALLATAREVEGFAATTTGAPSADFADRVMLAVAAEAPPRPVASGGFLAGIIVAFRDAWRIAWSGDRPFAVRAQAFALVLLVLVAVGSTGTLAAVGVSRLLGNDASPPPSVEPSLLPSTALPTPSLLPPTASPSELPGPSTEPSSSTESSDDPRATGEPSETPDATEGGGSSTPRPTRTPRPTARPTETSDGHETPEPSQTQEPEDTPEPDDTPHPSGTPDDGGSSGHDGSGSGSHDGSMGG